MVDAGQRRRRLGRAGRRRLDHAFQHRRRGGRSRRAGTGGVFDDGFRDAERAFENANRDDRRRRKKDQKRQKVHFEVHRLQIHRQDFHEG